MTSRSVQVGILVLIVSLGAVTGLAAAETVTGEQNIETQELSPGETTTVTIDVELDTIDDPAVYLEFNSSFAAVEPITTDPSARIAAGADANDGVFALWEDTEAATLQYEVTVPDDASEGDTYQLTGEVETEDETTDITGDTLIVVSEADSGSSSGSNESGSATSSPVEPGAAITVTPAAATVGEEITFSANESVAQEQTIDSYKWVIDGTTFDNETVTHSFDEAVSYDVELTVTTESGASNIITTVVPVDAPDDDPTETDEPADTEESDDEPTGDDESTDSENSDSVPVLAIPTVAVILLSIALVIRQRQH
ncbi:PKD domain-containing protein [Natronorubrum sp. A-ect3]|uniref:PKD domain-containing protein n=1 Tax=Natronorubrum sp. A-ect3 TaxID=3242698 RepID=UPI00359CE17F